MGGPGDFAMTGVSHHIMLLLRASEHLVAVRFGDLTL
jgi:hypothetical protein